MFTIISDEARAVDATVQGGQVSIDAALLPDVLGWELKEQGLCRGDVCVPAPDLAVAGQVDLVAVASALSRPVVIDADAGIAAIALAGELRRRALDGLEAPGFTLPDVDGNLHDLAAWRGKKKLLVAFSTW